MPRLLLSSPAKRSTTATTRVENVASPKTTTTIQPTNPVVDWKSDVGRVKFLRLKNEQRQTELMKFTVQTEYIPCDPLPRMLGFNEIPCDALPCALLHVPTEIPCDALFPFSHSTLQVCSDKPPAALEPHKNSNNAVLFAFKQDVSKIPAEGSLLLRFTNNPQQVPPQQDPLNEILAAKRAILHRLEQEQQSVLSTVLAVKRNILLLLQNQLKAAAGILNSTDKLEQVLQDKRDVLARLNDHRVLRHKQSILTLLRTL